MFASWLEWKLRADLGRQCRIEAGEPISLGEFNLSVSKFVILCILLFTCCSAVTEACMPYLRGHLILII